MNPFFSSERIYLGCVYQRLKKESVFAISIIDVKQNKEAIFNAWKKLYWI